MNNEFDRNIEIFRMICSGKSSGSISNEFGISNGRVWQIFRSIGRKLHIQAKNGGVKMPDLDESVGLAYFRNNADFWLLELGKFAESRRNCLAVD
jgi:hypothetical protein